METAEVVEEDGQVFHFRSPECRAEKGYHEIMDDPSGRNGANPPDLR